ncbi:MAG: cyclopropane-fatty-acyl-phospholipid synthase family protein [Pirellulales bacterium]
MLIDWAESGWLPDWAIRTGIRRLLAGRLGEQNVSADRESCIRQWRDEFGTGPLCVETQAANEQHYEVPAEFFQLTLGPHLKYSCCWWDDSTPDLAAAERRMLELTAERALLAPGQEVLDLGCGWGSFSLWAATRYPESRFTAVSNSRTQRAFIESQIAMRGLRNLRVLTQNMAELNLPDTFDRIVSVEMFEHMRNYRLLWQRLAPLLRPGGRLFGHVFCHRSMAYKFEDRGATDWMSRHFFTGGTMPSRDLLTVFSEDLVCEQQWDVSGTHYQRTCEAWLQNLDRHRERLLQVLSDPNSPRLGRLRLQRWRMFMMSCAELFGYAGGNEWFVTHFRLRPAGE